MKTSVNYDRHQKTWIATNETTYAHTDKRNVLLYALKCDHPDLWTRVRTIEIVTSQNGKINVTLIDRLLDACSLITKGKVFDGVVLSQTDGQAYATPRLNLSSWACECIDYANGGIITTAYGKHCKHTLAQLLAYFTGAKLPTYQSRQMQREADFAYYAAQKNGEMLEYLYHEILREYAGKLHYQAEKLLKVAPSQVAAEIKACSPETFTRLFEIQEIDGEDYQDFWQPFYEAAMNGQLAPLKSKLIDALNQL